MNRLLQHLLLLATLFCISTGKVYGQLGVLPINDVNLLMDLFKGKGVEIIDPVLDCHPMASGGFLGVASNIPIDTGIVLSTGLVTSLMGPNQNPQLGHDLLFPGDTFFSILTNLPSFDKCVLRFKVIPMGSELEMDYVFGSEEYNERVCCPDADRFGIFITGQAPFPIPGIGTQYNHTNVAFVPGVNPFLEVGINSVNRGVVGQCVLNCTSLTNSHLFIDNSHSSTEELDGFTVNLPILVPVVPCDTYTVRIAIVDIGDALRNSALFLKANSLRSGGYNITGTTAANSPPYLVEGCNDGLVRITRSRTDSLGAWVYFGFGGSATNQIDYSFPDSAFFPPNSMRLDLRVLALPDTITEGTEQIEIYLLNPCTGNPMDTIYFEIWDKLRVNAIPKDTTVCRGHPVSLLATGAAQYLWSPTNGLSDSNIASPIALPDDTTVYVVQGTWGNCVEYDSVIIRVLPNAEVEVSPDTSVCPQERVLLEGTVLPVGMPFFWSPAGRLVNPNQLTTLTTPMQSTTAFVLTATYLNGCQFTDTVLVTVHDLPNVDAGPRVLVCPGDSARLNVTGANSYSWIPATGLSNPSIGDPWVKPLSNTVYTVWGTDTNGCRNFDLLQVALLSNPNVTILPAGPICPGSQVQVTANGASSYIWTPGASLSDSTIQRPIASPVVTTTYTVIGTDPIGCSNTATMTLTVRPEPVADIQSQPLAVCIGDTVRLTGSGGVQYSWSPASMVSNASVPDPYLILNQTTSLTLVVTDAFGCTGRDSITLAPLPKPVISVNGPNSLCQGDTVTLFAQGGLSYEWSPSAGLNTTSGPNPLAFPASSTTYTVRITDSNGCKAETTHFLNVFPNPQVSAGSDQAICIGDTAILQGLGASSYIWAGSNMSCSNCPSTQVWPISSATYTLTGTDASGCTSTDTVQVNMISKPVIVISVSAPGVCSGDTIFLQASGADNYSWQPPLTFTGPQGATGFVIPNQTQLYTVIGTLASGCSDTTSIWLQRYGIPFFPGGNSDTICLGDTIALQAFGGSQYEWSPGNWLTDSTISNPGAFPPVSTTFTLTVQDTNGCSGSATLDIVIANPPPVSAGNDRQICFGDSVQLQASGAVSYLWQHLATLSCSNCPNPTFTGANSEILVVEGTSVYGCTGYDTVQIIVLPLPVVQAGQNQSLCLGDTVTLSASGANTYSWLPANRLSTPNSSSTLAYPDITTSYTVTGTDANGCVNQASVTVTVNPNPIVFAASDTTICAGEAAPLSASGTATYQWLPAASVQNATVANTVALPVVSTRYTVTGTNTSGCSDTASVFIAVVPYPSVQVNTLDTVRCPGDTLLLSATGATTYSWAPSAGLSQPGSAQTLAFPISTTIYTLTATGSTGCSISIPVTIRVNPPLDTTISPNQASICPGDSIQLHATGQASMYLWQPSASLSSATTADPMAFPASTTTYSLALWDADGCAYTGTATIQLYPPAIANAGTDTSIIRGEQVQLDGSGNGSFWWSPAYGLINDRALQNPIAAPELTTRYTLLVTTPEGCTATDSVLVTVIGQTSLWLPNAFSPNGDGVNDLFSIASNQPFYLETLVVFNRWGEEVFRTSDPNQGWDGTFMGEQAYIGTYVYFLKGKGLLGEPILRQGNVTLIR